MATAVKAIYQNGVFKPKEPVRLQDDTEVEVLLPADAQVEDDDPTGWKTARELIGCIVEKPKAPLISENHDRQIYGRK